MHVSAAVPLIWGVRVSHTSLVCLLPVALLFLRRSTG